MDKTIVLALLPILALVILLCFVALEIKGGRAIKIRLKGLGIELNINAQGKEDHNVKDDGS